MFTLTTDDRNDGHEMEGHRVLNGWRFSINRSHAKLLFAFALIPLLSQGIARAAEEPVAALEAQAPAEANTPETAPDAAAEAPAVEAPPVEEAAEASDPAEAGEPVAGEGAEGEKSEEAPPWYRGTFEAEVDSVITDGGSDLDFSQYLRLEADPPQKPKLHLHGALWLHQDLLSDEGKSSTLRDINDASSSDVQARLLYLYADFDDALGDQSVLRVGRQRIQEGALYNRIDGLFGKKRIGNVEMYAFLGARASVYRDTSDDLVLGGGLAYLPTPQTRIALDGYYAEESRYGLSSRKDLRPYSGYYRYIASEINDSKVTLSLWHNFGPNTRFFGRIGMLGSDLEELSLSLNGYIPRLNLLYDLNYRQLFNTTGDTTADLSPYYQVLGQYREHQTLYLALHRPITKKSHPLPRR